MEKSTETKLTEAEAALERVKKKLDDAEELEERKLRRLIICLTALVASFLASMAIITVSGFTDALSRDLEDIDIIRTIIILISIPVFLRLTFINLDFWSGEVRKAAPITFYAMLGTCITGSLLWLFKGLELMLALMTPMLGG